MERVPGGQVQVDSRPAGDQQRRAGGQVIVAHEQFSQRAVPPVVFVEAVDQQHKAVPSLAAGASGLRQQLAELGPLLGREPRRLVVDAVG